MGLKFETSEETCAYVRSITDRVICPFSLGKDSLASYLHMLQFWDKDQIVLVHMALPMHPDGLTRFAFIERSIRYYERMLGVRIYRMLHGETMNQLIAELFQPPPRVGSIRWLGYKDCLLVTSLQMMNDRPRMVDGWQGAWTGTGLRVTDSLQRRANILHAGSAIPNKKLFYPIWDWSIARVLATIKAAGLKLPIDYKWFGRSFDAWGTREMLSLHEHAPEDYAAMLRWFPLIETDWHRLAWRPRLLAEQAHDAAPA